MGEHWNSIILVCTASVFDWVIVLSMQQRAKTPSLTYLVYFVRKCQLLVFQTPTTMLEKN